MGKRVIYYVPKHLRRLLIPYVRRWGEKVARKVLYILSILILVVSDTLVTTTVASAETGSQVWILNSSNHPDCSSKKVMEKIGVELATAIFLSGGLVGLC